MVSHNNVIPNQHFKKKWQFYVKTWFNQPARKTRRQNARAEKAKKVFPRPVAGALRPVVHGQTVKYNLKKRYGRGFTLDELKEVGFTARKARTVGISVDHRRKNRSLESLQENANRLKAYKSKLVVFPRRSKKPKQGDASAEELSTAQQQNSRRVLPISEEKAETEFVDIPAELKDGQRAYYKLRLERTNAKLVGVRAKRAAEAAAEEAAKAK